MTKSEKLAKILVHVHPGAGRNSVVRFKDGVWHIRIAAPPVEGQANKELIKFLSEILGVSKNRLSIEKGATSRRKVIAVEGLTEVEVTDRLNKTIV